MVFYQLAKRCLTCLAENKKLKEIQNSDLYLIDSDMLHLEPPFQEKSFWIDFWTVESSRVFWIRGKEMLRQHAALSGGWVIKIAFINAQWECKL